MSPDGDVKYFEINMKLLVPFFSRKARVLAQGCVFLVEGVELGVGCEPGFGKVTKSTRIQCYKCVLGV